MCDINLWDPSYVEVTAWRRDAERQPRPVAIARR